MMRAIGGSLGTAPVCGGTPYVFNPARMPGVASDRQANSGSSRIES